MEYDRWLSSCVFLHCVRSIGVTCDLCVSLTGKPSATEEELWSAAAALRNQWRRLGTCLVNVTAVIIVIYDKKF